MTEKEYFNFLPFFFLLIFALPTTPGFTEELPPSSELEAELDDEDVYHIPNGRLRKNHERVCSRSAAPHEVIALEHNKESEKPSTRGYHFQFRALPKEYSPQNGKYQNDYFKIVERDDEEAIDKDCRDFRAGNVFFHLSRIHRYFQLLSRKLPSLMKEVNWPITVRIHDWAGWALTDTRTEDTNFNNAFVSCGHTNMDTFTFEESPEIRFLLPRRRLNLAGRISFICFIPIFANGGCAKEPSVDTALSPEVVYHEFVHLFTDKYINHCRGSVIGEAYSNYFAIRLSPFQSRGQGLPYSVSPKFARVKFKDVKPYKESWEIFSMNSFQHATNILGALGQAIDQMTAQNGKVNMTIADAVVLKSMYFLKQIAAEDKKRQGEHGALPEDQVPLVKHLPSALLAACSSHFGSQRNLALQCRQVIINNWSVEKKK